MTYLLDANCLVALVVPQHEHNERAHRFFARRMFAVTPLTQLALLQVLTRPRRMESTMHPPLHTPAEALRILRLLCDRRGRTFLPADLNCTGRLPFEAVTGHRQWNDFYLVAIAQSHGYLLATFDEALVRHFPEVCRLVP